MRNNEKNIIRSDIPLVSGDLNIDLTADPKMI